MKYKFIAIEREYGSGGTRIARCLAEECGIHCYGPEILEAVSTKLHMTANEIESTRNRFDAKRAKYYYANTAKRWDDFRNYDIILDSAALGVDGCVALKGLMK